jgi:hypothetical protein
LGDIVLVLWGHRPRSLGILAGFLKHRDTLETLQVDGIPIVPRLILRNNTQLWQLLSFSSLPWRDRLSNLYHNFYSSILETQVPEAHNDKNVY